MSGRREQIDPEDLRNAKRIGSAHTVDKTSLIPHFIVIVQNFSMKFQDDGEPVLKVNDV